MTVAGPKYPDLAFDNGIVALLTGTVDADGLPILTAAEGCHVYLPVADGCGTEPIDGKTVTPARPICVFAGKRHHKNKPDAWGIGLSPREGEG